MKNSQNSLTEELPDMGEEFSKTIAINDIE